MVDALAKVRLRNGKEVWLLVHVEIQGRRTPDFGERTYVCRYRIFDRHRQRVVSLAVYTGKGRAPEGRYEERALGDRLSLRFPVATIESFRSRRRMLERSRNPFAAVTLAHLALGAARRPEDHLRWKEELAGRFTGRDSRGRISLNCTVSSTGSWCCPRGCRGSTSATSRSWSGGRPCRC